MRPELLHGSHAVSATARRDASYNALLRTGCFIIGLTTPLSVFVAKFSVGPLSPTFVLVGLIALLGWWRGVKSAPILVYFRWAAVFSVAVTLSALAVGGNALRESFNVTSWTMFLIPGLAVVLSDKALRRSTLTGFILGASLFLTVSTLRVLSGQSPIDPGTGTNRRLLGQNRYPVDTAIVWLVPLMFVKGAYARLPSFVRWSYVVTSVVWIAASQGRTGAIALVLGPAVALALGLPKGKQSQQQRVLVLCAMAVLVVVGFTNVSIPGFGATERISAVTSGDRSNSDELRVLLAKKAVALAKEQPWAGVGWGNTSAAYHPVVEEATSSRMRDSLLSTHVHNGYLQVWSDSGTPALIGLLGLLFAPVIAAIRLGWAREVRGIVAGYLAILFVIAFHGAFGSDLYVPIAVLLGALANVTDNPEEAIT